MAHGIQKDMAEKYLDLIKMIRAEVLSLCEQAKDRLGISERELEKRIGLTQSTLAQMRARPDLVPNLKNIAKIAVFMRPRDLPTILQTSKTTETHLPDFDREIWDSLYDLYRNKADTKESQILQREVADLLRLARTLNFQPKTQD